MTMFLNLRVILIGIAGALIGIAPPYLIGQAINFYTKHGEIDTLIISVACVLIIATPCGRLASHLYIQKLSTATRKSLKTRLTEKIILKTTLENHGEAIDLIDGDVEGSIYLYHNIYLDIASSLSALLLALFIVFHYNPSLTIAPLSAILYIATFKILTRRAYLSSYKKYVETNTQLISNISNLRNSSSLSDLELIKENNRQIKLLSLISRAKIALLELVSNLSYLIGIILLFYIGSNSIANDTLSIGDFVSAAVYLERVLVPTGALVSIYYATGEARYRRMRIDRCLSGATDG
ncbi:ABC transporter transmembrane domain-containing protein [Pseudomonas sp. NFACC13-1]|uniref:ABC transporter transmembrane domain-containing protein n=1 Tax=Pseudomonas sp. NFACC13-1 TaxID=1566245 RepID=UPI0008800E45|nr:ABC transporter transmembrane domain-containing protein [Pseudomonas sp. NFACC13-1]SDB38471.1 ABC transporter transmembrane region [Pseudomonas sp. NFACC13-1]